MKKTTLNYKNLSILLLSVSILSFFLGAYIGAIREQNRIEARYIEVQKAISNDFQRDINLIYKRYIIKGYE
jgi:hypothetical protein